MSRQSGWSVCKICSEDYQSPMYAIYALCQALSVTTSLVDLNIETALLLWNSLDIYVWPHQRLKAQWCLVLLSIRTDIVMSHQTSTSSIKGNMISDDRRKRQIQTINTDMINFAVKNTKLVYTTSAVMCLCLSAGFGDVVKHMQALVCSVVRLNS